MEVCLLCLELKKEFVDSIVINSKQWHELNIQNVLDKYLWPMNHIEPTSWICTNCWSELYEFHIFYMRIEEAHRDLGLCIKKVTEVQINISNNEESLVNETSESPINGLKENPVLESQVSSVEEIRDLFNKNDLGKDNLKSISLNNDEQQRPLTEDEIYKEPLIDNLLVKRRKRGRPRKDTCNGNNITKAALKYTKICKKRKIKECQNTNDQTMQNKIYEIPIKTIEKVEENPKNIVNSLEMQLETNLLPVLEKPNLLLDDNSVSNIYIDPKSLDQLKNKSSYVTNCTLRNKQNEKDKFLAENFKITCFLCNIPLETFLNLRKHFEVHHTEPGHVKCCNKKFYRRSILVDHVHYHLNPNYFKCSQCGKVMADRRCLELHVENHENNHAKDHCCDICGKGFAKLGVLKKHRTIHLSEEEKRFSCSDCGKNFASNYLLSSHYRTVHQKKYTKICDICGKSIRCKDVFERHMLQHEGKTAPSVSCDVCGLILTDKKALKRHKDIIHPVGGQHDYTCSICSKTSPNLRAHKMHVQYKHVMGYDHKCTICDKAFKRAPTLKEHMASHTGTILYTCPWCPKTFNSNANMHNHRKKLHPKEWEEASRKRYSGNLPPNYKPPTITESSDFVVPLNI